MFVALSGDAFVVSFDFSPDRRYVAAAAAVVVAPRFQCSFNETFARFSNAFQANGSSINRGGRW